MPAANIKQSKRQSEPSHFIRYRALKVALGSMVGSLLWNLFNTITAKVPYGDEVRIDYIRIVMSLNSHSDESDEPWGSPRGSSPSPRRACWAGATPRCLRQSGPSKARGFLGAHTVVL